MIMMSMSRSTIHTILVLMITTVLILAGVWLVHSPGQSGSNGLGDPGTTPIDAPPGSKHTAPAVGRPAPDFAATTISGEPVRLSDLRGEPVWLVFGATWCANCRAEAPDVQAVSTQLNGRANVVSIYTGESTSVVTSYADRLKLTYPQIADSSETLASTYAIMGIPAHIFIASDGTIATIAVGTLTRQAALDILIPLL